MKAWAPSSATILLCAFGQLLRFRTLGAVITHTGGAYYAFSPSKSIAYLVPFTWQHYEVSHIIFPVGKSF